MFFLRGRKCCTHAVDDVYKGEGQYLITAYGVNLYFSSLIFMTSVETLFGDIDGVELILMR